MAIKPCTLRDNLMLEGGVIASGGGGVAAAALHSERYACLAALCCVAEAVATLLATPL